MKIKQTLSFEKSTKKLHWNQKKELDMAVKAILENPEIGQVKKGDLADVRVLKFKMLKSLTLLAYLWKEEEDEVTLLKLGVHENFYRDLKK